MRLTRKALQKGTGSGAARGFLDGQMLIASPGMQDERFSRTLIYMCAHSSEGAAGVLLIVVDTLSLDVVRGALFARGYRVSSRTLQP